MTKNHNDKHTDYADLEKKRYIMAHHVLHQYRYQPFKKLKYRNLRKDFYDHGLIPKGYFSYCLSSKQEFREVSSLDHILDHMVDMGDLVRMNSRIMADETGLNIDPKTTLFVATEETDDAYREELEHLVQENHRFRPPFRYQPQWLLSDLNREKEAGYKPRKDHDQWKPLGSLYGFSKRDGSEFTMV